MLPEVTTPEFIPANALSKISGYSVKSLYNYHASGKGALAPILTKFGGKLGAWRADWELLAAKQRKLVA